jgi:hypothetical protein
MKLLNIFRIIFQDPTDELTLRNISSQMKVRTPNFLNICFESLKFYNKSDKFRYILIDSHPNSDMIDLRYRSNIFPEHDGIIRPIIFMDNPKYKK